VTTSSVIDAILHPPLELLTDNSDGLLNPYGPGVVDLPLFDVARNTYGLTWGVHDSPPGAGFDIAVVKTWETRVLQVVMFNRLHVIGDVVAVQVFETHHDSGLLLWDHELPIGVSVHVASGFTVDFSWLVTV
jgi:hypothetical protein